jgi:hypothetical protein
MNDAELSRLVQQKLLDRFLLDQIPGIASDSRPGEPTRILAQFGGPFPESCAVCGGGPTQVRYSPSLAFHDRCHAIWQEAVASRQRRS